jgi:hypothetical protein
MHSEASKFPHFSFNWPFLGSNILLSTIVETFSVYILLSEYEIKVERHMKPHIKLEFYLFRVGPRTYKTAFSVSP